MDGLLERMVEVLESLDAHVVSLTEATKKLSAIQATGRRPRVVTDDVVQMETDFEKIFDELYDVAPYGEVTRGDILKHFGDCENDEVSSLIERYDLTNCRSKGYRAFIDHLRSKARRERHANGTTILVGLSMKTITYSETPNPDEDFF